MVDNDFVEDVVWEMWYDGVIVGDISFEDWLRIVNESYVRWYK